MAQVLHGDCLELMRDIPDKSVDMILTSPPYDNLRTYNESLDWGNSVWEPIIKSFFRIVKDGGVVVWIVGDATIDGSETGTSFRQALFFKSVGFNLHDTMIYEKDSFIKPSKNRYWSCFEYMFVFSKGKPKTANMIKDRLNSSRGKILNRKTLRNADGSISKRNPYYISDFGKRKNIWKYSAGYGKGQKNKIAYAHPATFPEKLAEDNILSWSEEGDLILDPFAGSGTTAIACLNTNRDYILMEKEQQYIDVIHDRLSQPRQLRLIA